MSREQKFIDKPCKKCGAQPAFYYIGKGFVRGTCVICDGIYRVEQWQRFSRQQSFWDPPFKIFERACTKCGESPAWYAKHASAKDGYRRDCVECQQKYRLEFYRQPIPRKKQAAYHQSHGKLKLQRLKREVFERYGLFCECCGEGSSLAFLTIDHVANNGAKHRKEIGIGSGARFYVWLRDHGWPDGYQTLCWTCNSARHINNGTCPHEEERLRLVA